MASSTARSVKMRLRACTLHLRTCGEDRDARSAEHKNTIIAMLPQGSLSATTEADDVLAAVTDPQLAPPWKVADLHAIAQAVQTAKNASRSRRQTQDFIYVLEFFTLAEWERWKSWGTRGSEPAASGAGDVGASNDSSESSETSSSSASTPTSKKEKAKKKKRKREKKEKKRAAKEKRQEIEAMKREKAAKKEEKTAKAAAAKEAKAAKDQERAQERAAEKAKTTAKAAATKIDAAIHNIQSLLRNTGSHLVPEATKLPLQQCLAEFEDNLILLNRIQLGDGNGGLEMPDVKKALATAKTREALFSATIRTYGGYGTTTRITC